MLKLFQLLMFISILRYFPCSLFIPGCSFSVFFSFYFYVIISRSFFVHFLFLLPFPLFPLLLLVFRNPFYRDPFSFRFSFDRWINRPFSNLQFPLSYVFSLHSLRLSMKLNIPKYKLRQFYSTYRTVCIVGSVISRLQSKV